MATGNDAIITIACKNMLNLIAIDSNFISLGISS